MIAQDYLEMVKRSEERIEVKKEELEKIKSMVFSETQDISPRETCSLPMSSNRRTDALVRYIDAKDELDETIAGVIEFRKEALNLIDELENSTYFYVLYKRYFEGKEWDTIADEMGYTYHHIHKIHSAALIKFQDVLDRKGI